jgi:hypothetical protein
MKGKLTLPIPMRRRHLFRSNTEPCGSVLHIRMLDYSTSSSKEEGNTYRLPFPVFVVEHPSFLRPSSRHLRSLRRNLVVRILVAGSLVDHILVGHTLVVADRNHRCWNPSSRHPYHRQRQPSCSAACFAVYPRTHYRRMTESLEAVVVVQG